MTSGILLDKLALNPWYFSGLKFAHLENIVPLTFQSTFGAQTPSLTMFLFEHFKIL